MTIKTVLEQLESSAKPVAKVLHSGDQFKVIVLGFKKGMVLGDHKAARPSKLTVLNGSVIYLEGDRKVVMNIYEETDIPPGIVHSVQAMEDSLCLLTQG